MITKAAARVAHIAQFVAADPGQVRYVPKWLVTLQQGTLKSRTPWLPFRVLDRIEAVLTPESRVFEYGGGGSTAWFADRGVTVVTVEHDEAWHRSLVAATSRLPGVDVLYESADNNYGSYVRAIGAYPDEHFDVVVVDGRERVRCMTEAVAKVKPGGLLILDDTDRDRYRPAFDLTDWPAVTYRGLTPSKTLAGVTTVWQRPAPLIL